MNRGLRATRNRGKVTSATQSFLVSNDGTGSLVLQAPTLSGSQAFSASTTCTATLAVGETCQVSVTFTPTAAVAASGSVTVASDATNSPVAVAMSGNGTGVTGALTAATSVNFGTVGAGNTASRSFTYQVTGNVAATNVQASLDDARLTFTANSCGTAASPVTLQPGSSCSMTVQFAPNNATALAAALTVQSSARNSPSTLSLTGSGANNAFSYIPLDTSLADITAGSTGTFQNIFGSGTTGTGTLSSVTSVSGGSAFLFTASGTGTTAISNAGGVIFPPNAGLAFGTGDFTIEASVNRVATNVYGASDYSGAVLSLKNAGGRFLLLVDDVGAKYGAVPTLLMNGTSYYLVDAKVSLNTWYKFTVTRRNGQVQIRVNDVLQTLYSATFDSNSEMATATALGTSVTNTMNMTGAPQLVLGNQANGANDAPRMWRGYIDEVRVYGNDITGP